MRNGLGSSLPRGHKMYGLGNSLPRGHVCTTCELYTRVEHCAARALQRQLEAAQPPGRRHPSSRAPAPRPLLPPPRRPVLQAIRLMIPHPRLEDTARWWRDLMTALVMCNTARSFAHESNACVIRRWAFLSLAFIDPLSCMPPPTTLLSTIFPPTSSTDFFPRDRKVYYKTTTNGGKR